MQRDETARELVAVAAVAGQDQLEADGMKLGRREHRLGREVVAVAEVVSVNEYAVVGMMDVIAEVVVGGVRRWVVVEAVDHGDESGLTLEGENGREGEVRREGGVP